MKNRFRIASSAVVVAGALCNSAAWAQNTKDGSVASSAPVEVTNALGAPAADLVFTPIAPCRIVDTRSATAGQLVAGVPQNFLVTSATGFATQGGSATDCGIPASATAVEMNFVAVGPAGPGDLRAYPYNAVPVVPAASVINYSNVTNLNIANGIAQPVCNAATTTCTFALTVQADVSATHLIVDVVGFYKAPVRPTMITLSDSAASTTSTTAVTIASMFTDLEAKGYTRARLVARFNNSQEVPACNTSLTLQLVDANRTTTLASLNRICGTRAWYDQSAIFTIQPPFSSTGTAYDLQALVTSAGTGVWRWVGLEVW
jgi:hypothetical protein